MNAGPTNPLVAVVVTVVPLSVMVELFGAPPAPPPRTSTFVFRIAEELSCTVELKYGTPPDVTVPLTVKGRAVEPPVMELQPNKPVAVANVNALDAETQLGKDCSVGIIGKNVLVLSVYWKPKAYCGSLPNPVCEPEAGV